MALRANHGAYFEPKCSALIIALRVRRYSRFSWLSSECDGTVRALHNGGDSVTESRLDGEFRHDDARRLGGSF
jgi:hypothetical protein